jgi:hypothetical protein
MSAGEVGVEVGAVVVVVVQVEVGVEVGVEEPADGVDDVVGVEVVVEGVGARPSRKITMLTGRKKWSRTTHIISKQNTALVFGANLQGLLGGVYRNSYVPTTSLMPICPPSTGGSVRRETSASWICSSSVSGSQA